MPCASTQILLFFCGSPVLDTFVPVAFQRERQLISTVTTCLPVKGPETKAFVLCKLSFWQDSPACCSSEELATLARLSELRACEWLWQEKNIWGKDWGITMVYGGDLKVIQRLASRGLPTETAYRVATWGEATVHSQEWLSILGFFLCTLPLWYAKYKGGN